MLRVTGSMSTKTGRAPTSRTTLLVATQVSGVVITSSPGPTPAIRSAISIVQVPELNARTGRPPKYSESFASNSFTCGPEVIQPERSTSADAGDRRLVDRRPGERQERHGRRRRGLAAGGGTAGAFGGLSGHVRAGC